MWKVIGASVIGSSHIKTGAPCQDKNLYKITKDHVFAAIADGLGSSSKSDIGALLAVETAIEKIHAAFELDLPRSSDSHKDVVRSAFHSARQRLEQEALSSNIPLCEFGTTLIVAIVEPTVTTIGHLGDGAVVALHSEGKFETISVPARGEYANETTSLTSDSALDSIRVTVIEKPLLGIAMFTDGLQHMAISSKDHSPFVPFFTPFFDALPLAKQTADISLQLAEFLSSSRVLERTDDDKTLLIISSSSHIDDKI